MIEQEFYTEAEIEMFRQQLRENMARAQEIVKAHGVKVHPRIKAAREEKEKNSKK